MLRNAVVIFVSLLGHPWRASVCAASVFFTVYRYAVLVSLTHSTPPSPECVLGEGDSDTVFPPSFAAGVAEKVELACGAVMFGCLLQHAGFLLHTSSNEKSRLNRSMLVTTSLGFVVSIFVYGTLASNLMPWVCLSASPPGSIPAWYPLRTLASMIVLPTLVGAVVQYCGCSPERVAVQSALTMCCSLAHVCVNYATSEAAWGAALVVMLLLFSTNIGLLVHMCVYLNRRVFSPRARTSIAVVALVGCAFASTECAYFLAAAVLPAGSNPASTRRLIYAVIDTACRVTMSLVFLTVDLHRAGGSLLDELDEVDRRRTLADGANEAQKLFTRWLFHELRIPMQSMVLAIDELQDTLLQPVQLYNSDYQQQQQQPTVAAQRECVAAAQAGAAQVCQLLESVMSLAKIEAGATRVDVAPFHVTHDLVRAAAAMFRPVLEKQRLRLSFRIAPTIASVVPGDVAKLKMALSNFLSNAIKFSAPGSSVTLAVEGVLTPASLLLQSVAESSSKAPPMPRSDASAAAAAGVVGSSAAAVADCDAGASCCSGWFRCCSRTKVEAAAAAGGSLEALPAADPPPPVGVLFHHPLQPAASSPEPIPDTPDPNGSYAAPDAQFVPCLRVSVTDTGVGIAAKDVKLLFRPFVQVRSTHVDAGGVKGAGLGLSICARMIELCGGRVGVASEAGKGSTFWLEVPVPATCVLPPHHRQLTGAQRAPGPSSTILMPAAAPISAIDIPAALADDDETGGTASTSSKGTGEAVALPCSGLSEPSLLHWRQGHSESSQAAPPVWLAIARASRRHGPAAAAAVGSTDGAEPQQPAAVVAYGAAIIASATASAAGAAMRMRPLRWAVVVDDVASNLTMFVRLLTRRGVKVLLTAEHGADCLAKLEALPAAEQLRLCAGCESALFLDKTMPVMDGLELTRRLRARPVPQCRVTVPIFAVTADALQEDQDAYVANGATAIITKPCTQATVANALACAGMRWPTPAEGETPPLLPQLGAVAISVSGQR